MNGHRQTGPACPVGATSGLMHRSKQLYSITSSARESSISGMVRARRSLHIARNSAGVSIIGIAMKTKFHRARGKPGLFAARCLSLDHCHRMLTASIVASSSLIVPLAVFKPAWPEEIEQAGESPNPQNVIARNFVSSWTSGTQRKHRVPSALGMCRNVAILIAQVSFTHTHICSGAATGRAACASARSAYRGCARRRALNRGQRLEQTEAGSSSQRVYPHPHSSAGPR
jgi:hypothetical protein